MPTNLLKKYPELLDLIGSMSDILKSLRGVYNKDIENNPDFKFRGIPIHPIKSTDGELEMDRTFKHLTTKEFDQYDDSGNLLSEKKRAFDANRARRIHWINHNVHETIPENLDIFTVIQWDAKKHQDVKHTYIIDTKGKHVIVFDRRGQKDFYLLTAFYMDDPYAEKKFKKLKKKRLKDVI